VTRAALRASASILRLMESDPDEEVRKTAVLFSRGLNPVIPPLIRASEDPSDLVRYYATFSLGCCMSQWFTGEREQYREAVGAALLSRMDDEDETVREYAVFGLRCGHDSPEVRERLRRALVDPDVEVQGMAALTLCCFRDSGAREAVERLLSANEVSANAFVAAQHLGDSALLPLLREASERYRRRCAARRKKPSGFDRMAIESLDALDRGASP
jgi:HEAT repeat protein